MISYHDTDSFYDSLFKSVTGSEGFRSFVYYDSVGVPTIGYGLALVVRINETWQVRSDLDTNYFNGITTLDTDQFERLIEAAAFLNNGDVDSAKELFPSPHADIDADATLNTMGFTITEQEAVTIYSRTAADAMSNLWTALGNELFGEVGLYPDDSPPNFGTREDVVDAFLNNEIPGSREMIALTSLAFNGPGIINAYRDAYRDTHNAYRDTHNST